MSHTNFEEKWLFVENSYLYYPDFESMPHIYIYEETNIYIYFCLQEEEKQRRREWRQQQIQLTKTIIEKSDMDG